MTSPASDFHDDETTTSYRDETTLCGATPTCAEPGAFSDAHGHAACREHGGVAPRNLPADVRRLVASAATRRDYGAIARILGDADVDLAWLAEELIQTDRPRAHAFAVDLVRLGVEPHLLVPSLAQRLASALLGMNHPRLTDSQLRDIQPGDRVSRYSRPGEVQTAPVARLTATQIVVIWPDETEARYCRESGTRTNCRGEVLRMPADDSAPDTVDAPSAPGLPVELLTLSTPCPVFYAALGPFLASHEARREGVAITHQPGKTWVVALVDGMPVGCGAVFLPEGDQAELASAFVLPEYRHQGVYRRLLLARTELANAAGKTRIVATCTPASAAILARLGFVAIGESAGYTMMSLSAK